MKAHRVLLIPAIALAFAAEFTALTTVRNAGTETLSVPQPMITI